MHLPPTEAHAKGCYPTKWHTVCCLDGFIRGNVRLVHV